VVTLRSAAQVDKAKEEDLRKTEFQLTSSGAVSGPSKNAISRSTGCKFEKAWFVDAHFPNPISFADFLCCTTGIEPYRLLDSLRQSAQDRHGESKH
jgi:hypothetical protein